MVFPKTKGSNAEKQVTQARVSSTREQARTAGLMSDDHFTVDGTLIDAWASMKSFQRKEPGKQKPPDDPDNPTVDFRGEKRRNDNRRRILNRSSHEKDSGSPRGWRFQDRR